MNEKPNLAHWEYARQIKTGSGWVYYLGAFGLDPCGAAEPRVAESPTEATWYADEDEVPAAEGAGNQDQRIVKRMVSSPREV